MNAEGTENAKIICGENLYSEGFLDYAYSPDLSEI